MTDATRSLLAAQDGDPDGFTRFVELTTGDVTRYCRYLGNAQHVDDLVQDTFLRALRSLHTYRGDTDGLRWLLGIARRACADSIEHHHRSRRAELTRRGPLLGDGRALRRDGVLHGTDRYSSVHEVG